jgi:hypothetical protein
MSPSFGPSFATTERLNTCPKQCHIALGRWPGSFLRYSATTGRRLRLSLSRRPWKSDLGEGRIDPGKRRSLKDGRGHTAPGGTDAASKAVESPAAAALFAISVEETGGEPFPTARRSWRWPTFDPTLRRQGGSIPIAPVKGISRRGSGDAFRSLARTCYL